MTNRNELTYDNLKTAVQVYYRVAHCKEIDDIILSKGVVSLLRVLDEFNFGELRLGFQSNGNAKFKVANGPYLHDKDGLEYLICIDSNDRGLSEETIKRNSEYKKRIEKALREEGFPVK